MAFEFLGKDKEQMTLIRRSFENVDERQAFDSLLLMINKDPNLSGPEKREAVIKAMMADNVWRSKLKHGIPSMFKEGLKLERSDGWKMSMKDIEKAMNLTAKELTDPKTGWMGSEKPIPSKDLYRMLRNEDLKYSDALKILSEAQAEADRKRNWEKEPWYNRAAMTAVAPLTSEDLSKGKPVDGIYTADYVGFGANVVPASRFIKALGPYGRTAVDVFAPSILEGATSVVADDVPVEQALENTGKNISIGSGFAAGGKGLGYLKSIGGALSKEGKGSINAAENLLKEGFYRSDLENKIARIDKMIKRGQRPSESDLELYESFNMLKKMGVDLSNLGKFSESKLNEYLNSLKKDPLKYADKARAAGKLEKGEKDLFDRRNSIRSTYGTVDQFKFDNNPGKVTFTDLVLESPNTKFKIDYETGRVVPTGSHLEKYGWSPSAGFGEARGANTRSSMKNHPGITGAERPSFASHIEAGRKAGLAHTDPYYPRNLEVNKAAEELMLKYPQLKLYFSKIHEDPRKRDWFFNVLIPYLSRHSLATVKTEPEKKEEKE